MHGMTRSRRLSGHSTSLRNRHSAYSGTSNRMMTKIMLGLVVGALLIYSVGLFVLYRYQERLIFVPTRLPEHQQFSFSRPHQEVFVDVSGARLNGLVFEQPNAVGTILYFHGNAGALDTWGDVGEDFSPYPYNLVVFDYRGYGKSTGAIDSELQLHQDALALYEFARSRFEVDRFVIVGRSIGTGIAARLAAQHPPEKLILETPYFSLPDLVKTIYPIVPSSLLRYRLNTARWIRDLAMPIHLIHGDLDPLIPFKSSERLVALNSNAKLHTIHGAVHNNISEFDSYHQSLAIIFEANGQ
jgi:uncharacterized protein